MLGRTGRILDLTPPHRGAPCILYLIRHGATDNNLADPPRLQGSGVNPELSAEGNAQAERTALQLSKLSIHAVYSSPLKRAMQTGYPIARSHGLTCRDVPGLIEVDVGAWQDRHWEEIEQSEPEAYQNFIRNPATHPYAGGESFSDVARRVIPVFQQLAQEHLGKTIVVIGHNVVNRVFLADIARIPLAKSRKILQANCGINLIRYHQNNFQLVTMNSAFHLTSG